MAADPFLDQDLRVLTPEAFDFVFGNELKRAMRSQNFVTLLLIDAAGRGAAERRQMAREIAHLVSREVRETDLLSPTDEGRLSLVLLDADLQNSMRVVDRLRARIEHYQFANPMAISVGAACCPMHGADAESLRLAAEARSLDEGRRESRGNTTAQ
jgi:GGDEF domain-containing protein